MLGLKPQSLQRKAHFQMARLAPKASRYIKTTFGDHLRSLRGGMKLEDLETEAKVAASYISALEHGKYQPSLAVLLGLQHGLGLSSLEELVGTVDSPYMPSRRLWDDATKLLHDDAGGESSPARDNLGPRGSG